MIFVLKPGDDERLILEKVKSYLSERGLNVSAKKTRITKTADGFDFLGWNFRVKPNGKFISTPSKESYKNIKKKIKEIGNSSNIGARDKVKKLAPVVRGWRNYHRFCDLEKFNLFLTEKRIWKVLARESKLSRANVDELIGKAFPSVSYKINGFVNVKGDKSPFDGDFIYWSKRKSKLYNGETAYLLHKQAYQCTYCGKYFYNEEQINLHHKDGNHNNWKRSNLCVIHASCHKHLHMSEKRMQESGFLDDVPY
jgi:5-methylcytosine-specific restriction endonuclease McrA